MAQVVRLSNFRVVDNCPIFHIVVVQSKIAKKRCLLGSFKERDMKDLHSMVWQGNQSYDEYLGGIEGLPEHVRTAWDEANDAMTFARALAKAHFGDQATPDHAVAIFQAVTADIGQRARSRRMDTE